MTVTSPTARNDYIGAGSYGPYAYGFRIYLATDLTVTTQDTSGNVATVAYPGGYTVTGVGNRTGGTITLATALAVGWTMTIQRIRPLTQLINYRNQGAGFPANVEDGFDQLVMIAQYLQSEVASAIRIPTTLNPAIIDTAINSFLPTYYLRVRADGLGVEGVTNVVAAQNFIQDGTGAVVRSANSKMAEQFSVTDFGATGNGVTDDTANVQKCLNAAPNGSEVIFPKGTYLCQALNVTNKSDFVIRGQGATIKYSGGTLVDNAVGLELVGTITRVTVRDLAFVGDGVAVNRHIGVFVTSGQTVVDLQILNCHIRDTVIGISVSADSSGSIAGLLIQGNVIDHVHGTGTGEGYGIHHANGSGNGSYAKIIGNHINRAERHAIYQARGRDVVIANNTISNHRIDVATGAQFFAIACSRSSDIAIVNNVLANTSDCGIGITTGVPTDPTTQRILVKGNVLDGSANGVVLMSVGNQSPSLSAPVNDVLIEGNSFFIDGAVASCACLEIFSGKRISVIGNRTVQLALTGGATPVVILAGLDEGGATATYTDELVFAHNTFFATNGAGGTTYGWQMNALFCASIITTTFVANRVQVGTHTFRYVAAFTNPNFIYDNVDGPAHVAGDYALSGNWGAGASVAVSARDTGGRVSVTAAGIPGANPTITLQFKETTLAFAPAFSYARGDITAPTTGWWALTGVSSTAAVWTFLGTPVAASVYVLDFVTIGK